MTNIVCGVAIVVAVDFTNKAGKKTIGWALPGGDITQSPIVATATAQRMHDYMTGRRC